MTTRTIKPPSQNRYRKCKIDEKDSTKKCTPAQLAILTTFRQ